VLLFDYIYIDINIKLFLFFFNDFESDYKPQYLVGVSNTRHATHDTKDIVINGIYTYLGSVGTANSSGRKNKLKNSVINSREVACSRWLVLLRAKGEGVDVDTSVRVSGVVLVRLDNIKVGSLTLRESVLAVKLKLSGDDRVLTPAMEVKSSLGKNECSGIRDIGTTSSGKTGEGVGSVGISSTGTFKDTARDKGIRTR